jgi:hypothetical protein
MPATGLYSIPPFGQLWTMRPAEEADRPQFERLVERPCRSLPPYAFSPTAASRGVRRAERPLVGAAPSRYLGTRKLKIDPTRKLVFYLFLCRS